MEGETASADYRTAAVNLPAPSFTLIGYAALAGLILGLLGGWRVTSWVYQAHELSTVKAALTAEQKQSALTLQKLQSDVKNAQTASKGYQDELATLRTQPRPSGAIRLCVPAKRPAEVPPASTAESGPHDPDAAPRGHPSTDGPGVAAGPDIAGDLYGIADSADILIARCRALQMYVRGITREE